MRFMIITKDEAITMGFDINNGRNLLIKYSDPNFQTLQINENGNWIDIRCAEDYDIKKGTAELIDLGVAMKIPEGYEAHLVVRSSTFKKYGLIQTNGIGIIDTSYSGNNDIWKLPVFALDRDIKVSKGDRLCQFRLVPSMDNMNIFNNSNSIIIEVDDLDSVDRGGFGSTGR